MKIPQLKQLLSQYEQEQLRIIVTEMYKALPKKILEEKGIDNLILNPQLFAESKKLKKTAASEMDMNVLRSETEAFLDNAYKQHYFAPNRIIHKKERPKWRFIVKRLTDQLLTSAEIEENAAEAAELLVKLYLMLLHASGSYLFSTEDPFGSIRISQTDYFSKIVALKARIEMPKKWIQDSLLLIANGGTDHNTISDDLISILLEYATTAPLKEMMIEQGQLLLKEMPRSASKQQDSWNYKQKLKSLHLAVFLSYIHLTDYDEAIIYFKNNFTESSEEIKLYVLLKYLFVYGLKALWLREYDAAVKTGVKPRDGLKKMRTYIIDHNTFPEYILY